MKALIVIDMQAGMLAGNPAPRDVDDVVRRINRLAQAVRETGSLVVFVQHHGPQGDAFAEGAPGWEFLPTLERLPADSVIAKTACDSFYNSGLDALLRKHEVDELIVTGWATDYCVDTTIRVAASHEYRITVVSDAHTCADRPHLSSDRVIEHHHQTWADLIVPRGTIQVVDTECVVEQLMNS